MYIHNMELELLNESFVFMVAMTCICFTPFMVDPAWRIYVSYFLVTQLIIIISSNLLIMFHSIIWQTYFKMAQEEKAYEAIIQRSKTTIAKQAKYEAEHERTKLQVINEISSSDDDIDSARPPDLYDLEQLVAIRPMEEDDVYSGEKESGLDISEASGAEPSESIGGENQMEAFDNYLTQWGHKLNAQMDDNEMKASAYT